MSHHNHGMSGFTAFAIVAAIAFAFGLQVARIVVGSVLIAGVLAFTYIMFRVVVGTI